MSATTTQLLNSLPSSQNQHGKLLGVLLLGILIGIGAQRAFFSSSNEIDLHVQRFQDQAKQSLQQAESLYGSSIREMAYPYFWKAFQETNFAMNLRPDSTLEVQKIDIGKKLFQWASQNHHRVLARYLFEELQGLDLLLETDKFDFENQLALLESPETKKIKGSEKAPQKSEALKATTSESIPSEKPLPEPETSIKTEVPSEDAPLSQAILLYQQGIEKSAQSDWEGAITCFTQAIELNPQDALSFCYRALAKNALGASAEALLDYTRAIEIDPQKTASYKGRAEVLQTRGEWENALSDYQKALQLNPQDLWVQERIQQLLKKTKPTIPDPSDSSKEPPSVPSDAISYFETGIKHYRAGDWNEALNAINSAIRLDAQKALYYFHRGEIKKALQDGDGAIEDFSKAIEGDPQNAEAYNERAVLYYQKKRFSEALADLNKAIKLQPKGVKYYNNRGAIRMAMNEWKGALKDIETAIRLDPQFAAAYQNRADLKKHLKEWDGAILDQTLAQLIEGNQRRELQDWDGALDAYTQGYRVNAQYARSFQNPYYLEILYYRGTVWIEKKELESAKTDFKEYLRYTQYSKTTEVQKRQKWILSKFPDLLR